MNMKELLRKCWEASREHAVIKHDNDRWIGVTFGQDFESWWEAEGRILAYRPDPSETIRIEPCPLIDSCIITRWISVEERLPEVGGDVLWYWSDGTIEKGILKQSADGKLTIEWSDDAWAPLNYTINGYAAGGDITHWMPLPEGPT